jgi:hypothetical protein
MSADLPLGIAKLRAFNGNGNTSLGGSKNFQEQLLGRENLPRLKICSVDKQII